jgi:hypothetical protein
MNLEFGTADKIGAFSRLPWHDSEFLGWSVVYESDGEANVTFDINFGNSEIVTGRAQVAFHDCRGFFAGVDLLAKRLCSDQVATGYCEDAEESDSEFVKQLNDRFDLYPGESMQGLFVFGIKLIYPGGELVVVARSFSLLQSASPEIG